MTFPRSLLLLLLACACGEPGGVTTPDGSVPADASTPLVDGGTSADSGTGNPEVDAGETPDSGTVTPQPDGGPPDSGTIVDCNGPFIPAERRLFAQPQNATIANTLVVNPDKPGGAIPPPGTFYVQVVAMGANPMGQAIPWAVGDFTKLYPTSPTTTQRGIAADWVGSTAVQIDKGDIGMQIHTESIRARGTLERALQTITVLRSFPDQNAYRPWRTASSEVEVSIDLRVPRYSMIGPTVAYVNLYALLSDTTKPNLKVWVGAGISDTRQEPLRDFVLVDGVAAGGTGYAVVHSDLRLGAGYITPVNSTALRTAWPDLKTFKFRIRAADLIKGLQQAKAQLGGAFPFSLKPADYHLELLALNPEIALVQNLPAYDSWMALSLRNYGAIERTECFDEALYLAAYPDVAAAVQSGATTAKGHYESRGRWEGRNGCGTPSCEFNEPLYLACTPDAKAAVAAGTYPSAWAHYSAVGLPSRRLACRR